MNLADLLSRITNLLDAETDPDDLLYPWHDAMSWTADPVPEVVEPPEPVENIDLTRALILADAGRYADLTDREKVAVLDIFARLDADYPPDDLIPVTEDDDPEPDAMTASGTLGFRWL